MITRTPRRPAVSDKKKKRKAGAAASTAAAKPAEKAPAVEREAGAEAAVAEKHAVEKKAAPAEAVTMGTDGPIPADELFGLMGWFQTPGELFHACEELRDAGYKEFDAHTPFPVHGLEK